MNILIPIIFIIAAVSFQYLTVYLAYLPVSRKAVTQWQMHKTSLLVTGFSILAGILAGIAGASSSVAIPITAVMVYQMGRRMLQQSNKQAWASAGIFIGITLLLIAIFVYLIVTSETFQKLFLSMVQYGTV